MRPAVVLPILLVPALARAGDPSAKTDASQSVETGSFLPFTDSAANEVSNAKTFGIYDGARDSAALDTTVEGKLSERFQVEGHLLLREGQVEPAIEGQFDAFSADKNGFDLQLAAGFDANGFNEVPAAYARLSGGADYRGTYLIAATTFELGTQEGERAAGLGLAGIRDLGGHVYLGFDGQLRVDLERDQMEPQGEATWDLQSGPLVSYARGRFAATAAMGLTARQERMATTSDAGAFGTLGVGAVF